MTTDEAIKLLHSLQGETAEQLNTPIQKAIQLGIDALKGIFELRNYRRISEFYRLPNETGE